MVPRDLSRLCITVTLSLSFVVLGRLRYDNSSLGCGEKNNKGRQAGKITDAHKANIKCNLSLINRKMQFKPSNLLFTCQLSSSKRILIQLLLISLLSLLSLCRRFDLYFVKIAVKPQTALKHSRCSASPRTLRLLSACLWESDNQRELRGRLKKQAYLISWTSDTAEWDRKVSAVQELLPQIVALSSAGVYLMDGARGVGRGMEKWQGKRLSSWEECLRIGKLLWGLPASHRLRKVNVKFHSE